MKAKIIIEFAENDPSTVFDIHWNLLFFPSIGDSLDLIEILSEGQVSETKNIYFTTRTALYSAEVSLFEVLEDCHNNKIVDILWSKEEVEIHIKPKRFTEKQIWERKEHNTNTSGKN